MPYKLELPTSSHLHSVFHMSNLKEYREGPTSYMTSLPLIEPEAIIPQPMAILECRIRARKLEVLVHW